jgi:hypothetical protein
MPERRRPRTWMPQRRRARPRRRYARWREPGPVPQARRLEGSARYRAEGRRRRLRREPAKLHFANEHTDRINARQRSVRYHMMFLSPASYDAFFGALKARGGGDVHVGDAGDSRPVATQAPSPAQSRPRAGRRTSGSGTLLDHRHEDLDEHLGLARPAAPYCPGVHAVSRSTSSRRSYNLTMSSTNEANSGDTVRTAGSSPVPWQRRHAGRAALPARRRAPGPGCRSQRPSQASTSCRGSPFQDVDPLRRPGPCGPRAASMVRAADTRTDVPGWAATSGSCTTVRSTAAASTAPMASRASDCMRSGARGRRLRRRGCPSRWACTPAGVVRAS